MGFTELASLDADVTVALGKVDKKTGKKYPTKAEGYYLGKRTVEGKKGESNLHFLQTQDGNLGVWGTTDLDRKMGQVKEGVMVRITSTGTKATKNGDMYTYKVEVDSANTIEVNLSDAALSEDASDDTGFQTHSNDDDFGDNSESDEDAAQNAALLAAERAKQQAKVQEILNRGKSKKA